MYYTSVPLFVRFFLPSQLEWSVKTIQKVIYLTFDDGPIPEITPWVLDQLDKFEAKATFFCVGDNVRKYPEIFSEIVSRGHSPGNHSFNHMQAWKVPLEEYLSNVKKCQELVKSRLFRPPHGQITPKLARILGHDYRLIMWNLLSRDFDRKISALNCLNMSIQKTRPGSIVVFHDSIKAWERLEFTLPRYLEYFREKGFDFAIL